MGGSTIPDRASEPGIPARRVAGWYPDPESADWWRYWDGEIWTKSTKAKAVPAGNGARPTVTVVLLTVIAVIVLLVLTGCFLMVGVVGGLMNQGL